MGEDKDIVGFGMAISRPEGEESSLLLFVLSCTCSYASATSQLRWMIRLKSGSSISALRLYRIRRSRTPSATASPPPITSKPMVASPTMNLALGKASCSFDCGMSLFFDLYHSSVAMRGSAREPINAWVPLFINSEHWKVVFPQIKGILGYLATLDPLGYNPNQVDLFYLILATMVSRLSTTPGLIPLVVRLLYCWHLKDNYSPCT